MSSSLLKSDANYADNCLAVSTIMNKKKAQVLTQYTSLHTCTDPQYVIDAHTVYHNFYHAHALIFWPWKQPELQI